MNTWELCASMGVRHRVLSDEEIEIIYKGKALCTVGVRNYHCISEHEIDNIKKIVDFYKTFS